MLGLPWWLRSKKKKKKIHLQCRRCEFDLWVRKIPWRRAWPPTPVLLPGKPFSSLKKNIGLSLIYSCERNLLLSSSCSSIFIIHLLKLHLLMLFSSQVMSDSSVTPRIVAHQAPLSMGFPINNTGVGGHALLQGIFLTQKSNSRLLHYRWIFFFFLYCRATKEAPMLHKLQSIELNRMILSLFPKANNQSN